MNKPTLLDKLLEERKKAAARKDSPAAEMLDRLQLWISAFEQELSADHEIGIITQGSPAPFRLSKVSIAEPDLLLFLGIDESGLRTMLVQHHSQCAITLVQLPKLNGETFSMGFIGPSGQTQD